jgi:hypothetical protein
MVILLIPRCPVFFTATTDAAAVNVEGVSGLSAKTNSGA